MKDRKDIKDKELDKAAGGLFNSGDTNTGFANTGNYNTGSGNSGDYNTGIF